MDYPEEVLEAVRRAVANHPDDAQAAVDCADRDIRGLSCFEDLVSGMVRDAVQGLVYGERHQVNVRLRAAAGAYGGAAKVHGASAAVNRACESYYAYSVAGRALGELTGADLPEAAAAEQARAEGHAFNARLCSELARLVPADRRVRDALTEKKLAALFRRLAGEAA